MNKTQITSFLGWVFLSLLITVGCSQITPNPSTTSPSAASTASLTVSAAASLKDAMEQIKPLYNQENPEVELTYNLGSSGALQRQIEQGAPADIFVSAATKQMDALEKQGLLLEGTRQDLLKNQLVLIVPQNSTGVKDFQDLVKPSVKKIALGEPKSVPAGQYAQEVLTSLNVLAQVKPKAVYAKDVRQALNYVESGNTDAGIVYLSDAKISPQVKVVATADETTHKPITYPVAVLKSSNNIDAAKEFVQFLSSDQAKAVFEKQGFTVIVN
ncbi:molybdate ABC transporter substrate-binding protein [Calothrix sp. CCY 0018]|uniref:molybdate ABC transporter substrate-binding protein n=1 Tax=Calothrix sp. CCY 0018 TaxID=3103864 RepID=UPI0039C6951C